MLTLFIATGNTNKVQEIGATLNELGIKHIELVDFSAYPSYTPPQENGNTFAENAIIKAQAAALYSQKATLADDSGLEVLALNGAPGIFSARFAGAGHNDAANNAKLLTMLADTPAQNRQAAFVCVLALALPNRQFWLAKGRVEGIILETPRGEGGFGYDPLFYLPEYGLSMAELSQKEKNRISHRALALKKALPLINNLNNFNRNN
ncbi:MAG: XTP/dITP diphosphatase [Firmicutes bacterium]|nr:XTP/dITP diphosphatase [Bacillota bacterium]